MTSQPVEQRGDFKEWNYTETHLPVRRVDEHNACVTALREALAREAALREAFRRQVVNIPVPGDGYATCKECGSIWEPGTPEPHTPGCLAALGQEESKP